MLQRPPESILDGPKRFNPITHLYRSRFRSATLIFLPRILESDVNRRVRQLQSTRHLMTHSYQEFRFPSKRETDRHKGKFMYLEAGFYSAESSELLAQ